MTPPGSESFQFSPLRADLAANCLNILPLITSTTHDTWNDRAIWWTIFHGVEFETKSSERIEGALVTGHFATSRDLYARCLYFPSVNSLEQCSSSRAGGSRTPRTNLSFLFLSPSLSLFLSLSLSLSLSLCLYLSIYLSVVSVLKSGPVRGGSVTCRHRGCIIMRSSPCCFASAARFFVYRDAYVINGKH